MHPHSGHYLPLFLRQTPTCPVYRKIEVPKPEVFGAKNQTYMPPPVEDHIAACQHSAKPLDGAKLAELAKKFADSIPEDEFSVAALQGCELFDFFGHVIDCVLRFDIVFLGLVRVRCKRLLLISFD
jgi:hypothetical protein